MLLGLLAGAAAAATWYRSIHGHFPWSAGRLASAERTTIPLLGTRETSGSEGLRTSIAQPAPGTQPAGSAMRPAPGAGTEARPVQHEAAATRPTQVRTTPPDPAQAERDAQAGLAALKAGRLPEARELLGRAYLGGPTPEREQELRERMAELAGETLFSGKWIKDDPLTERVVIQSGETLGVLAGRYHVPQDYIAAVNRIRDRNLIREGQRLKVVNGPFHATVSKSRHLMDLYLRNVYVRSFRVGLGMDGSTPEGTWKVANRQADPGWADPRTGQRWHPSDPNNPIGEYWIGLAGVEGDAVGQAGYGIHGTIEPGSIGKDVSMGCIRMAPDDIALLYQILMPGESYVVITE